MSLVSEAQGRGSVGEEAWIRLWEASKTRWSGERGGFKSPQCHGVCEGHGWSTGILETCVKEDSSGLLDRTE